MTRLAPGASRGDDAAMPPSRRGGRRPGAGRPPADDPARPIYVHVPASLRARLLAVLDPGETMSTAGVAAIEAMVRERERNR